MERRAIQAIVRILHKNVWY